MCYDSWHFHRFIDRWLLCSTRTVTFSTNTNWYIKSDKKDGGWNIAETKHSEDLCLSDVYLLCSSGTLLTLLCSVVWRGPFDDSRPGRVFDYFCTILQLDYHILQFSDQCGREMVTFQDSRDFWLPAWTICSLRKEYCLITQNVWKTEYCVCNLLAHQIWANRTEMLHSQFFWHLHAKFTWITSAQLYQGPHRA